MTGPDYKQSGGATLGNSGNNTSSSSGGRGLMGTVKEKLDNVRYVRSRDKSSKDSTSSSSGAARKSARLGQINTLLWQKKSSFFHYSPSGVTTNLSKKIMNSFSFLVLVFHPNNGLSLQNTFFKIIFFKF